MTLRLKQVSTRTSLEQSSRRNDPPRREHALEVGGLCYAAAVQANGWIRVAAVEDVPPGTLKAVRAGKQYYALANLEGQLFALLNDCPHRGGPLAGGRLMGSEIACAWHGFRFDVRSGQAIMPTDHDPVATIPVRVVDGAIELAVDQPE